MKRFISALILLSVTLPVWAGVKEREAEITFKIALNAPPDAKEVRLWVPYPVSDKNQIIEDDMG